LEQLEALWESWLNRLIIALLVIAFFDYRNRQDVENDSPHVQTTVSQSDEKQSRSRLLDEVEEGKEMKEENKKEIGQSEANDTNERFQETPNPRHDEQKQPLHQDEKIVRDESAVNQAAVAETEKSRDMKVNDPPVIKATTNEHPGMANFGYWLDIECSLFRIYTLGRRDNVEVVPPYVPHSYRGTIPIFLHVTNST